MSPVPASVWTARRLQSAVANSCAQDTTRSVPREIPFFREEKGWKDTHTTDSSENVKRR